MQIERILLICKHHSQAEQETSRRTGDNSFVYTYHYLVIYSYVCDILTVSYIDGILPKGSYSPCPLYFHTAVLNTLLIDTLGYHRFRYVIYSTSRGHLYCTHFVVSYLDMDCHTSILRFSQCQRRNLVNMGIFFIWNIVGETKYNRAVNTSRGYTLRMLTKHRILSHF